MRTPDVSVEEMKSDCFRLGSGAFFTRLLYLHGKIPLSIIGALLLIALILAFSVDYRFAIVGLMIVFLIAPASFGWLYVKWGLAEDASFNVAWHNLEASDESLTVHILRPVYEEVSEEEYHSDKNDEDSPKSAESPKERIAGWETWREMRFESSRLGKYIVGGDGITVPVDNGKGFIAIVRSAFESDDAYLEFVEKIGALLKKNLL